MKGALGGVARLARRAGLGGLLAIWRDGVDALLLRLGRPVLGAPVGGRTLRGFLRHRSFLAEVERGDYEPTLRQLIVTQAGPATLFLDVGAHVGYYSVLAAQAGADVIAVEPDLYNRAALAANVRGLAVDVRAAAIADRVGHAAFHPSESTTGGSLLARTDIALRRAVTVETTTVDALLADRDARPLLLKLDVEGAEPLALAGASETLRSTQNVVVVAEVNPSALGARSYTVADITAPLERAGYTIEFVDQGGVIGRVPVDPKKGNVVARRN